MKNYPTRIKKIMPILSVTSGRRTSSIHALLLRRFELSQTSRTGQMMLVCFRVIVLIYIYIYPYIHIRVTPSTLGWPYTEGNWFCCNCFIWVYLVLWIFLTCTVFVLTCFVMCGCVYVWVFGNMYNCVYCVLYCFYYVFCIVFFMYIYSYLFCLCLCKD